MLNPSNNPDLIAHLLARIPTPPPPYTAPTNPTTTTKNAKPGPMPTSPPITLTIDTGLHVLGTSNSLQIPYYMPSSGTPAEHARVAALIAHIAKQPDTKGRAIHVRLQSGVRVCGSQNKVVLGGPLRGVNGNGNEVRVAAPVTAAVAGQGTENTNEAAKKRKAEEELSGAPDVKKREGGDGVA